MATVTSAFYPPPPSERVSRGSFILEGRGLALAPPQGGAGVALALGSPCLGLSPTLRPLLWLRPRPRPNPPAPPRPQTLLVCSGHLCLSCSCHRPVRCLISSASTAGSFSVGVLT